MSTKIRKLTNISENNISIVLVGGTIIHLPTKGVLENIEVADVTGIAKWVKLELDLSEVNPVHEGRVQIFG
jgi:hypothetical protein